MTTANRTEETGRPAASRPGLPWAFVLLIRLFAWLAAVPYALWRHDTMADFSEATGYCARTGARLVALDAGHFSMLVRSEENDAAVRAFVRSVLIDVRDAAAGLGPARPAGFAAVTGPGDGVGSP